MATVRPFKGLRPAKAYAEKVAALPYDVMNREEAKEMSKGNPYSFLHISRAEIDLPESGDYDSAVYEKAKENLDRFEKEGVLVQDPEPSYYIYREVMDGRAQTGIVATVSVDEYEDGIIKRHEFTRKEKEKDRIRHFDICNANTEPIFLTYRDNRKLDAIIEGYAKSNEPEYDIVADGDVRHVLWRVLDHNVISSISEIFRSISNLYIADGHHRTASACAVAAKRREENPNYTGDEEFNYIMAAIFPDTELKIYDYNRVVKDLNGLSVDDFIIQIKEAGFNVSELADRIDSEDEADYNRIRPKKRHEFTMFLSGKWYKLTAEERIIPDDEVASLDVAILQDNLLAPVLAIGDPRTDPRIDFVGGIRGMKELERRVHDDMELAIAVYPVDIGDLLNVADAGKVMPPKSTWFEPKLESGLFIHKL